MNFINTLREIADNTKPASPQDRRDKYIVFAVQSGAWEYVLTPVGHLIQFESLLQGAVPSASWRALGVAYHHWKVSWYASWQKAFTNADVLRHGYLFDYDYGTIRHWSRRIQAVSTWRYLVMRDFVESHAGKRLVWKFEKYNDEINHQLLEE